MSNSLPKTFKIIVIGEESFPKHDLQDIIIHCPNDNLSIERILNENDSSILILSCTNEILIRIKSLLLHYSNICTVYIQTDQMYILWPVELRSIHFECIQKTNRNQLMRHLFLKAMLCYVQQGTKYKQNGDNGLANLSFHQAKKALYQTQLIV